MLSNPEIAGAPASAVVGVVDLSTTSPESDRSPALRREVHQVTGIVISQLGISAPDAFARLQAHAFSTGRPIDDVARDIVTRVLEFDPLTE